MLITSLLSSFIIATLFIIITISRDRFLKITEINKQFAIGKILKLLLVLLMSLLLIILISMELADYYNINYSKIINNIQVRNTYILIVSLILFTILIFYLIVYVGELKSKSYYYIDNYCNTGKRLYILQRYKDHYICVYNDPISNNRVIVKVEDIINKDLIYYSKDGTHKLDFTKILTLSDKKWTLVLLIIPVTTFILASFLIIYILFVVNKLFDFGSPSFLFLSFSIVIIVLDFMVLYINCKKTITHFSNKKTSY